MAAQPLKIGMVCYPTFGGSGVVASELGHFLSQRGHEVHFICYNKPARLRTLGDRVHFHPVEVVSYPLFRFPPYTLALATKIYQVVESRGLDIIHAHYAVPHSTAAYLAQKMLQRVPAKVVTTLHGTDIELMGLDPSYKDVIHFSLRKSDLLTTVSLFLKERTWDEFPDCGEIRVIPNFVDIELFQRGGDPELEEEINPLGLPLLVHVSNFREVKNIPDIIEIFCMVYQRMPCRLVLVGEGPFTQVAKSLVRTHGLQEAVTFKSFLPNIQDVLGFSHMFLLTSTRESFGLSALEAQACGVPVASYSVGGVPEVIVDNETGLLEPFGNRVGLATRIVEILSNQARWQAFSDASRHRAVNHYEGNRICAAYEQSYRDVLEHTP